MLGLLLNDVTSSSVSPASLLRMHCHAPRSFRLSFGIRVAFCVYAPFFCYATQAAAQIGETATAPESSAQTQQRGALSGIVLDVEGQPVSGALIRLFGPNRLQVGQTESDPQGKFLFAELNPGNYELRVTVPPFRDRVQLVEVTPQGAVATVNFAQIEESVTVTANRGLLQDETKVAGTIRSLTLEKLEERAPDLLPRMLTEETGIIAQQWAMAFLDVFGDQAVIAEGESPRRPGRGRRRLRRRRRARRRTISRPANGDATCVASWPAGVC